ncbi:hypothetical protein BH23VER1_BH23VER1_12890 [soil metagenome]
MKATTPLTSSSTLIGFAALLLFACTSHAAVTFTDTSNITVGNTQVEDGGDVSDNPDVTGGMAGPIVPYTEIGLNTYGCCGPDFGAHNLNDGDVGSGVASDGLYAIADAGGPPVVLGFGSAIALGGIAVYNGYTNRDDGDYTLLDGSGNVLGAWSIFTGEGASNDGADSFWLTFNSPVVTDRLEISYAVGDCCGTPSFREIQVFAIPEPSGALMAAMGVAAFAFGSRRRR